MRGSIGTFLSNLCIICLFCPKQPAKHSFLRNISSASPPWGTWLRTSHLRIKREEKKPSTLPELNTRPQEFRTTAVLHLLTTMRTLNQAYLHQLVNDLGDWKIVFLDHQVLDALHDEGRRVLNELAERQNSTEFSGLLLWAQIILALRKAGMILTHHKSTPKFLLGFNWKKTQKDLNPGLLKPLNNQLNQHHFNPIHMDSLS